MSVPAPRRDAASNPHDAYTQSVFRELPQARGFFRGYLPDEVRELFDWRTLRLETGKFLSDQLQRDFADLRFSIRFAGQQRVHRITDFPTAHSSPLPNPPHTRGCLGCPSLAISIEGGKQAPPFQPKNPH